MRRTLIDENGVVVNVIEVDEKNFTPPEGYILGPGDGEIGDTWDGERYIKPSVPPRQPTLKDYQLAIQGEIDRTAKARNYDSGTSCASYVNSTVQQWAAEALAFVAWRDAVWAYAFAELEKVQKGEREQPTVREFVAELPKIEWPDS